MAVSRDPRDRHARQPAGAGAGPRDAGRLARPRLGPRRIAAGRHQDHRRRIQDRPLRRPAARACSPRRSTRRSSTAPSISPCIRPRTCRRCLPEGLAIAGFLPREDVRDAFISRAGASLAELPAGAVVGTASLRRQAQVRACGPISRSRSCAAMSRRGSQARARRGRRDAARAGRPEAARPRPAVTAILDIGGVPAGGGAGRHRDRSAPDDEHARAAGRASILDARPALAAERAFLAVLDGSCRTPIAGHARLDGASSSSAASCCGPTGRRAWRSSGGARAGDAAALGREAGLDLRARMPAGFLRLMRVLVTRPQADAERTAAGSRRSGTSAVVAPVTEIVPTGDPPRRAVRRSSSRAPMRPEALRSRRRTGRSSRSGAARRSAARRRLRRMCHGGRRCRVLSACSRKL